jgi:uncharacterized RDD family membrane protein YckC
MAGNSVARRLAARAAGDATYDDEIGQRASMSARSFAFLIDSVVLLVFAALIACVAGLVVFISSDSGKTDPSDTAFSAFAIILLAIVPLWLLFNLTLQGKKGQTIGQYVAGIQVVTEDGRPPGIGRLVLYWLALHPVLFHPLLAALWAAFAGVGLSLTGHEMLIYISLTGVILCVLGPVVALLSALIDSDRRPLHDRVAGVRVVNLT